MSRKSNALGALYRLAPGLKTLAEYRPAWLSADIAAGLSVAAVALPVGIAYAELARVPAVIGMYAAIFPLFAYALFGTSRQLMVGPDAATCMMMAAAIAPLAGGDAERYLALVVVMTLSVGLVYLAMGVFRLGFIANFLSLPAGDYPTIIRDAAGLALVSFTSGILTAKSFAQRNGYDIDANRELYGFGASNIASGLAQGFPVTGADSRTAINNAMGGHTQVVGVVAGIAMLLVLFFLTEPLAFVPNTALAAVIIVSSVGLIDLATLGELYAMSRIELGFSVGTTIGVLVLGVLPGVLLAIVLSLVLMLMLASKPTVSVLGKVPGMKGRHDLKDYPEARTTPGLLLFRFSANLLFYNVDYFKSCLLAAIDAAETPVEWVVVDASPINVIDSTALKKVEELIESLEARGITVAVAARRHAIGRLFDESWLNARRELTAKSTYPTLASAAKAFERRGRA